MRGFSRPWSVFLLNSPTPGIPYTPGVGQVVGRQAQLQTTEGPKGSLLAVRGQSSQVWTRHLRSETGLSREPRDSGTQEGRIREVPEAGSSQGIADEQSVIPYTCQPPSPTEPALFSQNLARPPRGMWPKR